MRWPRETFMLVMCVVFAPLTIGLITYALHEELAASAIGILVIGAFAYTAMARGRLLGTSVRVHQKQLPRVFGVVESCCKMLGVSMPLIFVREDLRVPLAAVGLREPYALIVSTVWLQQLADDELKFLVGRELGHIYARHTRLTSLLSPNGADNPILGFVMGPWLRRTEYTADRVGLLCCGKYDTAMRAILTTQFRDIAGAIDPTPFIEQRDEIETDPSLRVGELIGREPYATHRVHALRVFAGSPLFDYWRGRFDAFASSGETAVYKQPRGFLFPAALFIDGFLIILLANYLRASKRVAVTIDASDVPGLVSWFAVHAPWLAHHFGSHPTPLALSDFFTTGLAVVISLLIYIVITIILRRTPGMFVFGLQWRAPAVE
ncbi:MAG TPA: M48 family metallopeptidase [Candidatus Eremiobacteraceae bacterium]|nr:M48 family metallopeptidase [Candidatus Eremiobacteraceae bacterium]